MVHTDYRSSPGKQPACPLWTEAKHAQYADRQSAGHFLNISGKVGRKLTYAREPSAGEAGAVGEDDQLHPVPGREFEHEAADVGLRGSRRDVQPSADLGVGESL